MKELHYFRENMHPQGEYLGIVREQAADALRASKDTEDQSQVRVIYGPAGAGKSQFMRAVVDSMGEFLSDRGESDVHRFHFDFQGHVLREVKPYVFRTLREQSGISERDLFNAMTIISRDEHNWEELRSLVSQHTGGSGRIVVTAEHFDQVQRKGSDAAFAGFEALFLLPLIQSREGRFRECPTSVFLAERIVPKFRQFEVRRRVSVYSLDSLSPSLYGDSTYSHLLAQYASQYGLPTAQGFELTDRFLAQNEFGMNADQSNQLSGFLREQFFWRSGLVDFMTDFVPSRFPRDRVYETTVTILEGINNSFNVHPEPVGIVRFLNELAPFYEERRVSQSTAYLFCRGMVERFPTLMGWDDSRNEYVLRPFLSNFLTKTQYISDK